MDNVVVKSTGNQLTAVEFNQSTQEAINFVESSGLTLSGADWFQIAKGVAAYVASGDFYAESGTTNSYIASSIGLREAPTSYLDGMRVRFRTSNTNTGSSTINVNALGVKAIKKADGISDLNSGDIPAAEEIELIYNLALDVFTNYSHKYDNGMFETADVCTSFRIAKDGFLLMDDGTIGDAGSGATTMASAQAQLLFIELWDNVDDTWAPVSTGRGGSGLADFQAGKVMTLPRTLGRALSCAGLGSGLTLRFLGQHIGEEEHQLTEPELASHNHSSHGPDNPFGKNGPDVGWLHVNISDSTGTTGGDLPHNNMQPSSFMNYFIKL